MLVKVMLVCYMQTLYNVKIDNLKFLYIVFYVKMKINLVQQNYMKYMYNNLFP